MKSERESVMSKNKLEAQSHNKGDVNKSAMELGDKHEKDIDDRQMLLRVKNQHLGGTSNIDLDDHNMKGHHGRDTSSLANLAVDIYTPNASKMQHRRLQQQTLNSNRTSAKFLKSIEHSGQKDFLPKIGSTPLMKKKVSNKG